MVPSGVLCWTPKKQKKTDWFFKLFFFKVSLRICTFRPFGHHGSSGGRSGRFFWLLDLPLGCILNSHFYTYFQCFLMIFVFELTANLLWFLSKFSPLHIFPMLFNDFRVRTLLRPAHFAKILGGDPMSPWPPQLPWRACAGRLYYYRRSLNLLYPGK